jgi:hypothetical protein
MENRSAAEFVLGLVAIGIGILMIVAVTTLLMQRMTGGTSSSSSCSADSDCVLADRDLGYSCCWAGRCEPIDYSLPKWMAVNAGWLADGKAKNCLAPDKCGPAPGCPTRIINASFAAACVSGACQKVPI